MSSDNQPSPNDTSRNENPSTDFSSSETPSSKPPASDLKPNKSQNSQSPNSDHAKQKFEQSVAAVKQAEFDSDEEETQLWQGGYSPKAMVGTWIAIAILSVVLFVLPFLIEPLTVVMAIGAILLIWIFAGLRYAYRRLGYHYELTTQRFIHQSGLLSRQTDRIEVIDIDDVSFKQGPIQRMFGVGTIDLTGSDRTHPQLMMHGIAGVRDVSGLIDDTRRKERKRRSLHIESI